MEILKNLESASIPSSYNSGGRIIYDVREVEPRRQLGEFLIPVYESIFNINAKELNKTQFEYFIKLKELLYDDWEIRRIRTMPIFDINWKLILEFCEDKNYKDLYKEMTSDKNKIFDNFKRNRSSKSFNFAKDLYDYEYKPNNISKNPLTFNGKFLSYSPDNPSIMNDRNLVTLRIEHFTSHLSMSVVTKEEEDKLLELGFYLNGPSDEKSYNDEQTDEDWARALREGNKVLTNPQIRINWKRIEEYVRDGDSSKLHDEFMPEYLKVRSLIKQTSIQEKENDERKLN